MLKKWCPVVFLAMVGLMSTLVKAEVEVLSLNTEDLREMTLESIPAWPEEMVLSGTNQHWQKVQGCLLLLLAAIAHRAGD